MASEDIILFPPRSGERDVVRLYGQFNQTSGGAVSAYDRRRGISSVSWQSTGVLRVNLMKPYGALLDARLMFKPSSQQGLQWELKDDAYVGNYSTPYVEFYVMTGISPITLSTPTSLDVFVTLDLQDADV